ncbi:hypothetical protein jhhlp_008188 [Lomentospora prolificans]|uniref:Nephrocystin 3-like N-terminal domain-containing protein n=1 Tax=Lomentospora prolificans TaxID=41688 RepID=A0A2N3MZR5_9PEZI|nr:hypothetical protein jhhlp_008188 [Lomentospora prolificans]
MRMPKRINIVLDALDECTDQSGLLAWLKIISTQHDMNIHIVATMSGLSKIWFLARWNLYVVIFKHMSEERSKRSLSAEMGLLIRYIEIDIVKKAAGM